MNQTGVRRTLAICSLFLAVGCASSKKLLERGAYHEATLKAVAQLQRNPRSEKAQEVLRGAYPQAVTFYTDEVRRAREGHAPFAASATADAYGALNHLYEAIRQSPAAQRVVPGARPYYQEQAQAARQAAAEQYQAGEALLDGRRREDARRAYDHFLRANAYVSGYHDVAQRLAEAREAATLNVEIIYPGFPTYAMPDATTRFYEEVADALRKRQDEFIRFYTSDQARSLGIALPDQLVAFRLENLILGETNTVQRVEMVVSQDSVVVGEVETEAGGRQPVYEHVSAQLTTVRVEANTSALLTVVVRDGRTQAVLHRDDLQEAFPWTAEWATLVGDERALTKAEQILCTHSPVAPPPQDELFALVTDPIYEQLLQSIDRFYQDY